MKALVVYDTRFGNTQQIAEAVGGALGNDTPVVRAEEAGVSDLESVDILLVGSPTQGTRHTPAVQSFLDKIPPDGLKKMRVAAFDTRYSTKSGGIGTRLIARMAAGFGYAAPRIDEILKEKGGIPVAEPEGFIVNGTKGPLKEGEMERAAAWVTKIAEELMKKAGEDH